MRPGGRVNTEIRKRVKELLKEGYTQTAIASELEKAPSTIAHHVRALGVAPRKFFRALPLQNGKRRCEVCRRLKVADLFPSGANPTCTGCTIKQRAATSQN
jgi:IS30 family transposase